MTPIDEHDVVVVGGGAAGCVLAARLTEAGVGSVLLLEAGRRLRGPVALVPGLRQGFRDDVDWAYEVAPDSTRDGAVDRWNNGRALGGGSATNYMVWVRGAAADYDRWAEIGGPAWSAARVDDRFRRAEAWSGPVSGARDASRGRDGAVSVTPLGIDHPLTAAFVESAIAAGHRWNEDYNAGDPCGVSRVQVNQRRGTRHDVVRAYLGSSRAEAPVVRTGAVAEKIVVEDGRAVGVEYVVDGRRRTARARREVVLSAGAIATPKLLLLSGIGPAAELGALGIDVVADRPRVGRGLREHVAFPLRFQVRIRTLNQEVTPVGLVRHALAYAFAGRGALASTACHALVFDTSGSGAGRPGVQFIFQPYGLTGAGDGGGDPDGDPDGESVGDDPAGVLARLVRRRGGANAGRSVDADSVVTVQPVLLHPRAEGRVSLRSADPAAPPLVEHDLLADPRDIDALVAAGREVRRIFATDPLAKLTAAEVAPGPAVDDDASWASYLRTALFRMSHPSSTCALGEDPASVVDPELRVRGVEGLRVVDASVMPTTVSGNTHAPTIMIAEHGAHLVAEAWAGRASN